MKLGENILSLRKERNLTQEQLANAFSVSIAAVSKWETAAAYPDIELIPVIAQFFKVSVDYLLGYDLEAADKYIDESIDEAMKLYFSGESRKAVDHISAVAAKYPNNVKVRLANARLKVIATSGGNQSEQQKKLLDNAEKILLSTLDNHMATGKEYEECQMLLCNIYTIDKKFDKAIETITRLKRSEMGDLEQMEYMIYLKKGDKAYASRCMQQSIFRAVRSILNTIAWYYMAYYEQPQRIITANERCLGTLTCIA